jgi:hypothetical protein
MCPDCHWARSSLGKIVTGQDRHWAKSNLMLRLICYYILARLTGSGNCVEPDRVIVLSRVPGIEAPSTPRQISTASAAL